ncbi:MAG: hypothetical protein IPM53_03720 [Anaerolineaceae bacterium]|nr:hypothetical protein [Anaerolineaceae bacterium]
MDKTCYALLFIGLLVSACSLPEQTTDPLEVSFATPEAEIEGGVRLVPTEHRWDGYGEAVDVIGDVLAVGASEWNPCGHGSVYVYRASGEVWPLEAQLTASDRDEFSQQARLYEGQRFGTAVAVGEGIIAVGAPGNELSSTGASPGAVYLYEYDGRTWVETAKLMPDSLDNDAAQSELTPGFCGRFRPKQFGALVALEGDTLAVGGDASGLVYIFQRGDNGWQEQARVPIPAMSGKELYMASLSLFGDTLALSAFYVSPQEQPQDSVPVLSGTVMVYVFERMGDVWEVSFRFAPEEGDADLLFFPEVNVGASVALSGEANGANRLAIGLPGFPDLTGGLNPALAGGNLEEMPAFPPSNRQTGAVYLFERAETGWTWRVTLKPAGWAIPPGPGSFPSAPTHLEEGQENAPETGLMASIDLSDFVFPGQIYSEAPEITFFGATVDLGGDRLAVTAGFANATYVFERQDGSWVYRFSVKPANEKMEVWEDSAQVVRISGPILLLGTPSEFGNSAYVFRLAPAANDD